jgi:hypothetical protein
MNGKEGEEDKFSLFTTTETIGKHGDMRGQDAIDEMISNAGAGAFSDLTSTVGRHGDTTGQNIGARMAGSQKQPLSDADIMNGKGAAEEQRELMAKMQEKIERDEEAAAFEQRGREQEERRARERSRSRDRNEGKGKGDGEKKAGRRRRTKRRRKRSRNSWRSRRNKK